MSDIEVRIRSVFDGAGLDAAQAKLQQFAQTSLNPQAFKQFTTGISQVQQEYASLMNAFQPGVNITALMSKNAVDAQTALKGLGLSANQANYAVNNLNMPTKQLVSNLGVTEQAAEKAGKAIGGFTGYLIRHVAYMGTFMAIYGIVNFFQAGATAALEEATALNKLSGVLSTITPNFERATTTVHDFAQTMALTTLMSQNQVIDAYQRFIALGSSVAGAFDLVTAATNLAAARNISLEFATEALARGMEGQYTRLTRLGIVTKDTAGKSLDFEQILERINEQFTGVAESQMTGFVGELHRANAAMQELSETWGVFIEQVKAAFALGVIKLTVDMGLNTDPAAIKMIEEMKQGQLKEALRLRIILDTEGMDAFQKAIKDINGNIEKSSFEAWSFYGSLSAEELRAKLEEVYDAIAKINAEAERQKWGGGILGLATSAAGITREDTSIEGSIKKLEAKINLLQTDKELLQTQYQIAMAEGNTTGIQKKKEALLGTLTVLQMYYKSLLTNDSTNQEVNEALLKNYKEIAELQKSTTLGFGGFFDKANNWAEKSKERAKAAADEAKEMEKLAKEAADAARALQSAQVGYSVSHAQYLVDKAGLGYGDPASAERALKTALLAEESYNRTMAEQAAGTAEMFSYLQKAESVELQRLNLEKAVTKELQQQAGLFGLPEFVRFGLPMMLAQSNSNSSGSSPVIYQTNQVTVQGGYQMSAEEIASQISGQIYNFSQASVAGLRAGGW